MVEGYFLSEDGYKTSKLESGYFTLPANRNYSTTIFSITGNWNISGPNFSEAYVHVHTCIHVGYICSFTGFKCLVMSVSLLQQLLMFREPQLVVAVISL